MKPNSLDLRTYTIAQFVADFFADERTRAIDYTRDLDGECWNGYVAIVADAGAVLEEAAQAHIQEGHQIAEWYDVLEKATAEFRTLLLRDRSVPDPDALAAIFHDIVGEHLEV